MGTLLGRGWIEERWLSEREAITTPWRSLAENETHTLPRGTRLWLYERPLAGEHVSRLVELDGPGALRGPLAWAPAEESVRASRGRAAGRWLLASVLLLATAALSAALSLILEGAGAGTGLMGVVSRLVAVVSLTTGVLAGVRALVPWGVDVVRRRRWAGRFRARDGWRGWLAPAPEDLTRTIPSGDPPARMVEPERDDRPPLMRHADHVLQDLRTRASELPETESADLMASIERIEAALRQRTAVTLEDSRERGEVRDLEASLAALEAQIGIRGPGPAS